MIDDVKSSSPRRKVVAALTFYKVGDHCELEKQVAQRRYHLSWPDQETLQRELHAFLEAQRLGVSLADVLRQVSDAKPDGRIALPGPKGEIEFTAFCLEVLPQHRGRMSGWTPELQRIRQIVARSGLSGRPLHAIGPDDLREFYKQYAQRSEVTSDNTRGHMVKAIRAIFRTAVEAGYLREDPSRCLKIPSIPESNRRALTRAEAARLLALSEPVIRRWILVALYTGLRPTEIERLRAADVDVGDRRIRVVGYTKKNRPRDLFIHDEILPIMRDAASALPNLPLLRRPDGQPESRPRHAFDRALERTGLQNVVFYSLRHTFATWLLETGTRDEETRAYLLGHRVSRMSGRYTHVTFDMVRDAIQRLPKIGALQAGGIAV